jgi:hypothetical protein
MKPVLKNTPVTAQCPGGHTWETVILPGSTMPQTPSCPQCDMLVSSYPSLRRAERNRRANANRKARREALESTGLKCYRVNGREVWE